MLHQTSFGKGCLSFYKNYMIYNIFPINTDSNWPLLGQRFEFLPLCNWVCSLFYALYILFREYSQLFWSHNIKYLLVSFGLSLSISHLLNTQINTNLSVEPFLTSWLLIQFGHEAACNVSGDFGPRWSPVIHHNGGQNPRHFIWHEEERRKYNILNYCYLVG